MNRFRIYATISGVDGQQNITIPGLLLYPSIKACIVNQNDTSLFFCLNADLTGINTYVLHYSHNVTANRRGIIKEISISNSAGLSTDSELNYGTLPEEFRPTTTWSKWVCLRVGVFGMLTVKSNGEVMLSRVSGSVTNGTYITVFETYT